MKKLALLIVWIMASVNLAANATEISIISGVVTGADDNLPLPGVSVSLKGTKKGVTTDTNGKYSIGVPSGNQTLVFSYVGYDTREVKVEKKTVINVSLNPGTAALHEVVVTGYGAQQRKEVASAAVAVRGYATAKMMAPPVDIVGHNTEDYNAINENRFLEALKNPQSTFGVDVDAASYSNVRRYINNGSLPPIDAVRIEEMVNYFDYQYAQPSGKDPIAVHTEVSNAPWNKEHKLVKIGLKAKTIDTENLPASNLVFLIDVSGSMSSMNKLPLVQASMRLLTDQLRETDRVSIVVYAGAAGTVLEPTPGSDKAKIKEAINNLQAGGSTAGGAGIKLAYAKAREHFIKGGNNRVILATDGDFNVGVSSDADMQRLVEEERQSGVFLTVLGYGMGNVKDNKMETLANKGNGNYAYIDNIEEAQKVLVNEFGGTLFTIAKDVKLQIEFNPAKVQAYRLIGYENRMLNKEDFNNDKKDAGDMGAGHTVTALYEIIPVGVKSSFVEKVDDLKYQATAPVKGASNSKELMYVKIRYKDADANTSKLMETPVMDSFKDFNSTSENFRFAAAVAAYGMILRKSEFAQKATFDNVIAWAEAAKGADRNNYRAEFVKMVKSTKLLAKDLLPVAEK